MIVGSCRSHSYCSGLLLYMSPGCTALMVIGRSPVHISAFLELCIDSVTSSVQVVNLKKKGKKKKYLNSGTVTAIFLHSGTRSPNTEISVAPTREDLLPSAPSVCAAMCSRADTQTSCFVSFVEVLSSLPPPVNQRSDPLEQQSGSAARSLRLSRQSTE